MSKSAIVCQNVTKQYGVKRALSEFTLEIPQGRVVGILGPNGSGKSTLFRLITGLTRAEQGSIHVLGKLPGWRTNCDIAYLPDRARWYANHTVERAFHWAEQFLPGFDRATAERLAEQMHLELDMRAGGMSRGQEARLMLILCIARDVPIIILDEPFAGIDAISRERIIAGLIDHMSGGDRTVLISTHEIHEAEALFDYAVFLDEGRVLLGGDAEQLRSQYGAIHSIQQTLYR